MEQEYPLLIIDSVNRKKYTTAIFNDEDSSFGVITLNHEIQYEFFRIYEKIKIPLSWAGSQNDGNNISKQTAGHNRILQPVVAVVQPGSPASSSIALILCQLPALWTVFINSIRNGKSDAHRGSHSWQLSSLMTADYLLDNHWAIQYVCFVNRRPKPFFLSADNIQTITSMQPL